MKISCALLSVMVATILLPNTSAAPSLRETLMESEQILDDNNQVILRWTIINATNEIEMELQVNCTGWLGITILPPVWPAPGAVADIIMGGYNDGLNLGYIEVGSTCALEIFHKDKPNFKIYSSWHKGQVARHEHTSSTRWRRI